MAGKKPKIPESSPDPNGTRLPKQPTDPSPVPAPPERDPDTVGDPPETEPGVSAVPEDPETASPARGEPARESDEVF